MWKRKTAQEVPQEVPVPTPQVPSTNTQVEKKEWEVRQYPTQVADVLVNTKTGEQFDVLGALAELLNRTE